MDLNLILETEHSLLLEKVKLALKLGYEGIAINNYIEDFGKYHKTKKKSEIPKILAGEMVTVSDDEISGVKKSLGIKRTVKQFSRITIVLEDVNHTNKIRREENIRSYDLIAVQPTTEKMLQIACSSLEIDIISFDFTQRMPFDIFKQRKLIGQAIERGLMFEIQYSAIIRDAGLRRYVISNAINLVEVCKGKNIIISSGCQKAMEMRAPFDVQNLSLLFGLSELQTKHCIRDNCLKCITHGETARKGAAKCIVTITKLNDDQNQQQASLNDDRSQEESNMDTSAIHTVPNS